MSEIQPVVETRSRVAASDGASRAMSKAVQAGPELRIFDRFRMDPKVELAIWTRQLPLHLEEWLVEMPRQNLPDGRVLIEPRQTRAAMIEMFKQSRTPLNKMSALLIADVEVLVQQFAEIMNEDRVDVRLETVWGNACWKFHRDCIAGRLITTYRGATTQWVAESDEDAALREQRKFKGEIQHLPKHAVALFRGNCVPPARGVVHRSPPIQGSGQVRLLLCLNPPSAASPEAFDR